MSSDPPPISPDAPEQPVADGEIPPAPTDPPADPSAGGEEPPAPTKVFVDQMDPYGSCKIPRKTVSSCRRSSCGENELQPLPLISEAAPEAVEDLVIQKIRQCNQVFDFTKPLSQVKAKEVKRSALTELAAYFSDGKGDITDSMYPEVVSMVMHNAFRPLPPPSSPDFDPEEDEPTLETAWPHLRLVYEFFLCFLESTIFKSSVAKKYVDNRFVLNFIKLFDSEDPRERDFVKTVVHRLYGKFIGLRSYIRKEFHNIFLTYIWEDGPFNGICELLEILGSIVNGFATPLKEEHIVFLKRVLMPLHKPDSLGVYHSQLAYCIMQFLNKDHSLVPDVFALLLKYWSHTSSKKEVLCLAELDEMIDYMDRQQFQTLAIPLCKQLTKSFSSNSFQVTERALGIMQQDCFLNLVSSVANEVYPILVSGLFRVRESHWNMATRALVNFVLKELAEFDPAAFREAKSEDEKRQRRLARAPAERRRAVEEEAARAGLE